MLDNIRNILNKGGIIPFSFFPCLLMCCTLWYMHYEVMDGIMNIGIRDWYNPCFYIIFDVIVINIVFYFACIKKQRLALILSFIFIITISIINIIYSRFFHQYFSISAINEISNFQGNWWQGYIDKAFRTTDLLLVCFAILFLISIKKKNTPAPKFLQYIKKIGILLTLMFIFHFSIGDRYINSSQTQYNGIASYIDNNIGESFQHSFLYNQELTIFKCGVIRTQILCSLLQNFDSYELTSEDISGIDNFINLKNKNEGYLLEDSLFTTNKNVVFILVESFLSCVSDMTIDGIEITPNLNELKREQTVYYNDSIVSNKSIGESSDAQVLFFSGLLPLKTKITVTKIINDKVIGLPTLFKREGYSTHMTVPTASFFWHQNEANLVYGIDSIYSTITDLTWKSMGDDNEVFSLAISKEKKMKEPFFHVILTATMHAPYDWEKPSIANTQLPVCSSISNEYHTYLRECMFMDEQIGAYIDNLKQSGKYDNTVIIITADHEAHSDLLNTSLSNINNAFLPLYIVNSGIHDNVYQGKMNQADLYPTLIDIFHINSRFRGLGKSILRSNYCFDNLEKEQYTSDKIILGDYFATTTIRY